MHTLAVLGEFWTVQTRAQGVLCEQYFLGFDWLVQRLVTYPRPCLDLTRRVARHANQTFERLFRSDS
jgi:hypothetical protein